MKEEALIAAMQDMKNEGFDLDIFDNGERGEEIIKTAEAAPESVKAVYSSNGKRGRQTF